MTVEKYSFYPVMYPYTKIVPIDYNSKKNKVKPCYKSYTKHSNTKKRILDIYC